MPRRSRRWLPAPLLAVALASPGLASAQPEPHVGYLFPAGGQRGSELVVTVGGQHLQGVSAAYVSGEGIEARVVERRRAR